VALNLPVQRIDCYYVCLGSLFVVVNNSAQEYGTAAEDVREAETDLRLRDRRQGHVALNSPLSAALWWCAMLTHKDNCGK
jgi:hypothetical protein